NFALDDLAELDSQLLFDSIDSSSLHLNNLDIRLHRAFRCYTLCLFGGMLEHFLKKPLIRPDRHNAAREELQQLLMIDLRYRYVEFRPKPIFKAAYHHPLVLQRLCVRDVNVEGEQSDDYHENARTNFRTEEKFRETLRQVYMLSGVFPPS